MTTERRRFFTLIPTIIEGNTMVGHNPQQHSTYRENWNEVQSQLESIQRRIDRMPNPSHEDFIYYESYNTTLRELARALEGLREYLGIEE